MDIRFFFITDLRQSCWNSSCSLMSYYYITGMDKGPIFAYVLSVQTQPYRTSTYARQYTISLTCTLEHSTINTRHIHPLRTLLQRWKNFLINKIHLQNLYLWLSLHVRYSFPLFGSHPQTHTKHIVLLLQENLNVQFSVSKGTINIYDFSEIFMKYEYLKMGYSGKISSDIIQYLRKIRL